MSKSKKAAADPGEFVLVYPDHGPERHFLQGVPAVEQTLPAKEAAALVKSGAFSYDPPPAPDAPPAEPAPADVPEPPAAEPGPVADDEKES